MTCWALVPIKARAECKGRLSGELTPSARMSLARAMLSHVVGEACLARRIDQVIVVSPERDTLPGHIPVVVDRGDDLNEALRLGRDHAVSEGASELLVLAADLPAVTSAEIDEFIDVGRRHRVGIAPDLSGTGTNALFLGVPGAFRFSFGANSRYRHENEGRRLGVTPARISLPGLASDVDIGIDLRRWPLLGGPGSQPSVRAIP